MVEVARVEAQTAMHRLRTLRLEAALSQRELAELAGVSQFTITRLESGHPAYPSTIRKIAGVLKVAPKVLVDCGPPVQRGAA